MSVLEGDVDGRGVGPPDWLLLSNYSVSLPIGHNLMLLFYAEVCEVRLTLICLF